jgi:hypothetical protein
LEKEKLKIPSFCSSNDDIFAGSWNAPGDFSGLDLSKMIIERDMTLDSGDFKGIHLKHSRFDGSSFINIDLSTSNFESSSLKGVDFSRSPKNAEIVWIDADISGIYAGSDYVHSRRARNRHLISKNEAELAKFRSEQGLMVNNAQAVAAPLTVVAPTVVAKPAVVDNKNEKALALKKANDRLYEKGGIYQL